MSESQSAGSSQLSSVHNALRLLNRFTREQPEWRVSDLAEQLQLGKSTVSRLLSTLATEGFVIKDPRTRKYRLGLRILTLYSVLTQTLEISREAQPVLKWLMHETGEAAHIAVLEDDRVIYLDQVEISRPVEKLSYIGRRNPIHCTSSGKLLLAYRSDEYIRKVLTSELASYTKQTITDPMELYLSLQQIKKDGYCFSDGEYLKDIVSIAAPIKDYTGNVVASVTVVGLAERIHRQDRMMLIRRVQRAGKEISELLGYRPRP